MSDTFAERDAMIAENRQFRRDRLETESRLQRLAALEAENARLRELLDSTARIGSRALVAEILAVDLDPYRQRFDLNRGLVDGVYVGQALIDAQGVVGQVVRVGPLTSEAVLITDADHAVPVSVNRNGVRTIAVGTGDSSRLRLPYLTNNADVMVGDLLDLLRARRRVPGRLSRRARARRAAAARSSVRRDYRRARVVARPRSRGIARLECGRRSAACIGGRRRERGGRAVMAERRHWWASMLSLVATLALASVPVPDSIAPLRPDWVAVVLLYWSLMAPRQFSLLTAFWMGIALDTLTGALLGQNALALLVIVYLAEKFHLRLRVFPVSQLAFTVLLLLGLYEFILFWIDGMAGRTVPLIERWLPPLTGTLVWLAMYMLLDRREREVPARL